MSENVFALAHQRQHLSKVLMSNYERLDHLERTLADVTATAQPAPGSTDQPAHAKAREIEAIADALRLLEVFKGVSNRRGFDDLQVLENVRTNTQALMGTIAEMLLEVSLPSSRDRIDLPTLIGQAALAMEAFIKDPTCPIPPASYRAAS